MAELTVGDLVDRTYRKLHSVYSEEMDVINEGGQFTTADTTMTLLYASSTIGEGDIVEVEQELMYAISLTTNDLEIIRGYMDTTAVAHADGSHVRINPRFSRLDILNALRDTINSWSDLYWVDHATTNIDAHDNTNRGFVVSGLEDDFKEIKKIRYLNNDGVVASLNTSAAWVERDFLDSDYTYLNMERGFYSPTQSGGVNVDILYSRPFRTELFEEATLLETQIKLPPSMHDIPMMGALWRLLSTEEGASADPAPQGLYRNREERPPGYVQQVALTYRGLHDARASEEGLKLEERYG